jgi:hypothetical protein
MNEGKIASELTPTIKAIAETAALQLMAAYKMGYAHGQKDKDKKVK